MYFVHVYIYIYIFFFLKDTKKNFKKKISRFPNLSQKKRKIFKKKKKKVFGLGALSP